MVGAMPVCAPFTRAKGLVSDMQPVRALRGTPGVFMTWVRFAHTNTDGTHYFQCYSLPDAWERQTPKVAGTGRIAESAAETLSMLSPAGYAWRTPCHCVDCTVKRKAA